MKATNLVLSAINVMGPRGECFNDDTWPIGAHHICISCVYRQLCIVFCCLIMLFQVCKYSCIRAFIYILYYIILYYIILYYIILYYIILYYAYTHTHIYIYIFVHNATRSNTVYLRDVNNSTHAYTRSLPRRPRPDRRHLQIYFPEGWEVHTGSCIYPWYPLVN